jgi:hypothetical protein
MQQPAIVEEDVLGGNNQTRQAGGAQELEKNDQS